MATTTVSDAVVVPQDDGTGLASKDPNSAAAVALLSDFNGTPGVRSGLGFTRDDANDQIDIGPGFAFIRDDSSSTGGSRGSGGNAQIQAGSATYDTELPAEQIYCVVVPTTVSVAVTDATSSDIWLNITDVTSQNAAEIRSSSGGGTTAEPSDTYLKLGNISDSGSGPATRSSDIKGPSSRIHLQTVTANSSAEVVLDDFASVVFSKYIIELSNVYPSNSGVDLNGRVSIDGGATFESGASDYSYVFKKFKPTGEFRSGDVGAPQIVLFENDGDNSNSNPGSDMTITISGTSSSTTNTFLKYDLSHWNAGDTEFVRMVGGAEYTSTDVVDALRFKYGSGNIAAGTFALYGLVT